MKVLFVINNIFLSEPLGAMLLMSICKKERHDVRLADLFRQDIEAELEQFLPDVIAYSTMSADIETFRKGNLKIKEWAKKTGRKLFMIMGGPHATFNPKIINEFGLDAICIGDGDHALPELLSRLASNTSLKGIPNIALDSNGPKSKELFDRLDDLPFIERDEIYRIAPHYKEIGLRSFQAGRGCPYTCSYCFNDKYNKLFRGSGSLIRRRKVDNLIAEIKYNIEKYPPVRFIRFADDVFIYKKDDWLIEFSEKYPKEIGIPFYCLIRPNNFTEDVAELLALSGCKSVSMSVEHGMEKVRRENIRRYISDSTLAIAFGLARKYKIAVFGNSILGIPGTTLDDDLMSLEVSRKLKISAPTFSICTPYEGTTMWDDAIKNGFIKNTNKVSQNYMDLSMVNSFTDEEKKIQLRMAHLGTLYCTMPKPIAFIIKKLIYSNVSLKFSRKIGSLYLQYRVSTRIFPRVIPRTIKTIFFMIRDSLNTFKPVKRS